MIEIIEFLRGKKTHITALIMAVLNFLNAMGWISIDDMEAINGLLLALIAIFLRMGVKKTEFGTIKIKKTDEAIYVNTTTKENKTQ